LPGAELSVQSVANEAGLVRTVIYRHFDGKPELVRAVQAQLVGELRDTLDADIRLDRGLQQIVNATVATYVDWADKNPALHAAILSRSLWLQVAGQAKDIGIELNPSTALRELFAAGTA